QTPTRGHARRSTRRLAARQSPSSAARRRSPTHTMENTAKRTTEPGQLPRLLKPAAGTRTHSPYLDQGKARTAARAPASVLDDRFKARSFQPFFRGLHGFLVVVGANLNAVILVTLRRLYERGEPFLVQLTRERNRIGLRSYRRHLQ